MTDKSIPSERCRVAKAVAILGEPKRTVQALAARGLLPGAMKSPTGRWTFNEAALRQYVRNGERQQERAAWQKSGKRRSGVTGATKPYGGASRSAAPSSGGAYEQAMAALLRGAGKSAVSRN